MTQTPPQQYCLRWNNYQNNLTNVFDQLLQSGTFVDVTLACDGNSIKAHKMVLSACSPYFQTLFFDNPCSHPIVILNDVTWDELKAVVEFMYRGEINILQEQLAPILRVAETLKIRGLADVSRGSASTCAAAVESDVEKTGAGSSPGGHLMDHPLLNLAGPTLMHRRKRRKMSTPERSSSSPLEDDDNSSNQLEIDSQNGDWNNDQDNDQDLSPSPPRPMSAATIVTDNRATPSLPNEAMSTKLNLTENNGHFSSHASIPISMILGRNDSVTPTPANTPNPSDQAVAGSSRVVSASQGQMDTAFLNLHAAAAAAAAAAVGVQVSTNSGGSGGGGGGAGNNLSSTSTSSSLTSDLDLKPGIVEMIREEERAKMLESSHGWLGPAVGSSLTDTYQYQIQNLWQKCWNQNQGGVTHALRFRERGPLKSWRPETMAEAILAVLRDGLSLSQAARAFEIPYPTFVLYANRVHNMLGPSSDGCGGSDLMSDTRPKGRGRPQRILLGSWPEEHIRGVIRAVVFRDTPGAKEDFQCIFNRDIQGLCLPQVAASTGGSSSPHNGLDLALHRFPNQFLSSNAGLMISTEANLRQSLPSSTTPHTSIPSSPSAGENSGSQRSGTKLAGDNRSSNESPCLSISTRRGSISGGSKNFQGLDFVSKNMSMSEQSDRSVSAAATAAALQLLPQLQKQGILSTSTTTSSSEAQAQSGQTPLASRNSPSPLTTMNINMSSANSPLHKVLSDVGLLSAQVQKELLAFQQRQKLQQLQIKTEHDAQAAENKSDNDLAEVELTHGHSLAIASDKKLDDNGKGNHQEIADAGKSDKVEDTTGCGVGRIHDIDIATAAKIMDMQQARLQADLMKLLKRNSPSFKDTERNCNSASSRSSGSPNGNINENVIVAPTNNNDKEKETESISNDNVTVTNRNKDESDKDPSGDEAGIKSENNDNVALTA